jgi:hypothetical protein
LSYIAEQEDAGYPAYVTVRRPKGEVLAKLGYGLRFELPLRREPAIELAAWTDGLAPKTGH